MAFGLDSKKQNITDSEEEEVAIVEFEGELINCIDELKKARRKKKQLKEQLQHVEDGTNHFDNEELVYEK